jgi:hypothetical protein
MDTLPELLKSLNEAVLDKHNVDSFKNDLQTRERLSSEFNVQLFLTEGMAALENDCLLMLTSHGDFNSDYAEMRINGGRMKLEPVSRAIVKVLANTTVMTIGELRTHLATVEKQAVLRAVLDLASHDVITIERRSSKS